ncbi:MAG: ATP-binding protein [Myxococcota bacterium]
MREGHGRRPRRPRRKGRSELSPRDRAYREAALRADRKLRFVQHLVPYVFVVGLLVLIARPAAIFVAFGWGIGLASHFFQAFVMPDLRKRWIEGEVDRQVHDTVTSQRVALEGRQSRSLEELSASIAHEIRNPITAAKSLVQQMGEDPTSSENVEYARVALQELERVERSISHLLRYAREEEMRVEPVHLARVAAEAIESQRERLDREGIQVVPDLDTVGEMVGDPEKLRRVVLNLLGNSIDALSEKPVAEPRIHLGVGDNLAGDQVWLRLRDNGPGMDEATRARVFRPFFTSKANGTGLGLAVSKKLVDAHGGTIEIESEPGRGCTFVLTFPKALPRSAAGVASRATP